MIFPVKSEKERNQFLFNKKEKMRTNSLYLEICEIAAICKWKYILADF